jgi:hypothetical protein
MPPPIERESSPFDVVSEATKWHCFCNAIDILTGGREEKYSYEAAIASFVIKTWLSTSRSLLDAIRSAPSIFCCLILSEKINDIRKQEKSIHRPFVDVFNNAIDKHNLNPTLNAVFGKRNIIEFLVNNTWRPHRVAITNKKIKSEIERLNKLTEYRLRLGSEGYNFAANDAALLLGAMRNETAWKPTSVKDVRSCWKEKEAFLFTGQREEFSGIVSFSEVKISDLLQSNEADAINHERNINYFANVKGIISQLTPETSKELEKHERWRKIENRSPSALAQFNDDEREKIDEQGIKPTVRRSAEVTKAASRQRPRSK